MVSGDIASSIREVEAQLSSLLEKIDSQEGKLSHERSNKQINMMAEVRSLDLWRAVIAECLGTVFFVFLVCGSYSPWLGKSGMESEARVVVAMVTGFAMAVLIHSFGQVSGGHLNPAVTLGLSIARRISPLRATMFILAQLGGGIAGAALLYGATSSGYSGDLGATEISSSITLWQGFGVEFLLSLILVFVVYSSYNPLKKSVVATCSPAVIVGLTYIACTLVGFPLTGASMNPARSLGPAFVMNKWSHHWIYWVSPLLGGITAALIYEYIFNPYRVSLRNKDSLDGDSSSMMSEEDAYGDCSKASTRYNYNSLQPQSYEHYRQPHTKTTSPLGYPTNIYGQSGTASVYNAPAYKIDSNYGKEDIYSGSKSLYTKSPIPVRTSSLNRSQSVYVPPHSRSDTYYRNVTQRQNVSTKSPGSFTGLLKSGQSDYSYTKDKSRQDSHYYNKHPVVKPEPVYGIPTFTQETDSAYSTYQDSNMYSTRPNHPVPAVRSRNDVNTPNSISTQSGFNTPNSVGNFHSPNPQY